MNTADLWMKFCVYISTYLAFAYGKIDKTTGTGPVFILEPTQQQITFSNRYGTVVDCIVYGRPDPKVTWIKMNQHDGFSFKKVHNVSSLIDNFGNNSLVFHPFRRSQYRQEIHGGNLYSCKASNIHGSIISTPVKVTAVVDQVYRTQVFDEYVILGNTAIMKCNIPSYIGDYVKVTSWIINDDRKITNFRPESRFNVLENGNLHLRDVKMEDSESEFKCETQHSVTKQVVVSDRAGHLYVTKPTSSIPPKIINQMGIVNIRRKAGKTVQLSCVGQGFPPPTYSWCVRRESKDPCVPINANSTVKEDEYLFIGGLLMLFKVRLEDSGQYRCLVQNNVGQAVNTIQLLVTGIGTAYAHPQKQVIDVGQIGVLKCFVSGFYNESVTWLKDGQLIKDHRIHASNNILNITSVTRDTKGMYQCFIKDGGRYIQQATAEIMLGSVPPLLIETFEDQTVQPGPTVVLRCTASGSPTPAFQWTLAEAPVKMNHRINLMEVKKEQSDTTISELTINNIRTSDGGQYVCNASNKVGSESRAGNVHVYGLPHVRPMMNMTIAVGQQLTLNCHVFGYPIKLISWYHEGKQIISQGLTSLLPNGTLIIKKVESGVHDGRYKCKAENFKGYSSQGEGRVNILEPPILSSLIKLKILKMRSTLTILCVIQSGDPPLTFEWLYNGLRLPYDLRAEITETFDSSILKVTNAQSMHSGNYTCLVKNVAGQDSVRTMVKVRGPPKWIQQPPKIIKLKLKSSKWIHCIGQGYPQPKVTWHRIRSGETVKLLNSSKRFLYNNGSLHIYNMNMDDLGEYICTISNGIAPDLISRIRVELTEWEGVKTSSKHVMVDEGDSGKMKCIIENDNNYSVRWFKGVKEYSEFLTGRIYVRNTLTSAQKLTSTLTIDNIKNTDSGIYRCTARKSEQETNQLFNLIVRGGNGGIATETVVEIDSHGKGLQSGVINITGKGLPNDNEFIGVALLYIIPTTTASVVLFVVLIIVCVLLKKQTKLNESTHNHISNVANKMDGLNSFDESTIRNFEDGMKLGANTDSYTDHHRYYQLRKTDRSEDDEMCTLPEGELEIQPYATFTSIKHNETDSGRPSIELRSYK